VQRIRKFLYLIENAPYKKFPAARRLTRPGTAKGFVFLSLEDETGIANIIITPDVFERERMGVTRSRFLQITGPVQNQDGVVHVKAQEIAPLEITQADIGSRDFH
jgi:error-prone DNA polymerase